MKDFWILKVLDYFGFFYKVLGVDYGVMRKILQIKLLMDQRREPSVLINSKHKEEENTFIKSLILYGLMGLVLTLILLPPLPLFIKMNVIMGILIFMVMMSMVSDFSSILLDTRDKEILLSKPIRSQTVNAAKITHIFINLLTITFVMAGPSLIVGLYKYGLLFMGIYFFDLLLISGLILFLTSVLYFLMLLFFDGDKLKDVINYFQIILSLVLMLGYQFTGHVFKYISHSMVLSFKWWMYLVPSAWFAAPFTWILENSAEKHFIYLSLIGVSVPIFLLILYFGAVTQYFEKNLHKLDTVTAKKRKTVEKRAIIYKKLISVIIPNKLENVFCRFSQAMISSERSIRLRLYPNLGLATFLPVLIMLNTLLIMNNSLQEALTNISQGADYIFMYFTVSILSATTMGINSSENYKGAWVYKALPIELPGVILMGALKGFILKYVVPVYLFVGLIFAIPYGVRILPHPILIFCNMLLLIILIFKLSPNELPFGKKFQNGENNAGLAIGSLAFCGISALMHYWLKDVPVGLFIYCIVVLSVSVYLWKTSAQITWQDV